MKTGILMALAFAGGLAAVGVATAQDKPMDKPTDKPTPAAGKPTPPAAAAADPGMVSVEPADVKWTDAPPALPKGAKVALLYGDPAKPEVFVMRIKLPAGYKIPAHWHPQPEILTILSGTFFLGHGDALDLKAGKPYPPGGFIAMPPKMHHFAYTKKETVVQLSSTGPWGITYINPADDPRTPKAASN